MKILLPVDGVEDAKLIVDFVANYHWPPKSQFKLIHVLGSSETEQEAAKAEKEVSSLIVSTADRLKRILNCDQIESELLHGAAILEIINAATNWKAEMIVMGYRTRSMHERLVSGSVSNGVVMQAPCSVAVIRPPV